MVDLHVRLGIIGFDRLCAIWNMHFVIYYISLNSYNMHFITCFVFSTVSFTPTYLVHCIRSILCNNTFQNHRSWQEFICAQRVGAICPQSVGGKYLISIRLIFIQEWGTAHYVISLLMSILLRTCAYGQRGQGNLLVRCTEN